MRCNKKDPKTERFRSILLGYLPDVVFSFTIESRGAMSSALISEMRNYAIRSAAESGEVETPFCTSFGADDG